MKKFEEAEQKLREMLASGKFARGDRFPSEYQLADELGINRATVSKAVAALIADGLLQRADRSRRGTMVSMEERHAWKHLLFLVTNLYIYETEVYRGFQAAAFAAGYLPTLLNPHIDDLESAVASIPQGKFAGICTNIAWRSFQVPCVYFGRNDFAQGSRTEWDVSPDTYQGGRLIASHLAEMGKTDFIYILPYNRSYTRLKRVRGFMDRMRELGVAEPEKRTYLDLGGNPHSKREMLKQQKKKFSRINAIISTNDFLTQEFYKAAKELKWDLGSIAFAGFGNIREVRCSMPIITVDEHDFDVGRTAFEKLHRIIQRETRNEPREEILPVELIV